jgi:hypothetical protein
MRDCAAVETVKAAIAKAEVRIIFVRIFIKAQTASAGVQRKTKTRCI